MSSGLQFFWIDDNPEREKDAQNMKEQLQTDVQFFGLNNKDVGVELKNISKLPEPDLILMDHSLTLANDGAIKTGSSAAAIIRESWPSCPIVSVTATEIEEMDVRHRSAYEAIVLINKLSDNYDKILAIAYGFQSLGEAPIDCVGDILDRLGVPEVDGGKLTKIFPHELKDHFEDRSFCIELYRWCASTLFERPGFLYDRLWTCTLLGLSEQGFRKVEAKFESARYGGVFAMEPQQRWWKSQVLSILGEETGEYGLPWEIGRSLVASEDLALFSRCYCSDEFFPEIVAAVDDTESAEWHPMKLKYTEPHPHFEDMLFFEELRIMTPSE